MADPGQRRDGSLLLFDFDGVLADTLAIFHREFCRALPERADLRERERFLALFDGNLYVALGSLSLRPWRLRRFRQQIRAGLPSALAEADCFPGIVDCLSRLGDRHAVYVVSSNSGPAVQDFCARHQLRCVREVWGAERGLAKVGKIKRLRRRHPELEPCYIGDTTGDMHEAERAGAAAFGVAWGWHGSKRLQASPARHIFTTPEEIADYFAAPAEDAIPPRDTRNASEQDTVASTVERGRSGHPSSARHPRPPRTAR